MTDFAPINLRGELKFDEPLSSYNSWHVGGKARCIYRPADLADLAVFLSTLPSTEAIIWLGLGSNVLIRDAGIAGTVIHTLGGLKELASTEPGIIRAEAGIPCAKLAKFAAKQQLAEAAFFAGIPGTVGGALAMNAGAFGDETWRHVLAVETINRQGNIHRRKPEEFKIAYREVTLPAQEWFVAGYFSFPADKETTAIQDIKALLHKRNDTQPIGEFSCGSVFRNPPGKYAAQLISHCGLKGRRIGGAWVSTKHANFIINGGEASAADIESLIMLIQTVVKQEMGIELMPECHFLG